MPRRFCPLVVALQFFSDFLAPIILCALALDQECCLQRPGSGPRRLRRRRRDVDQVASCLVEGTRNKLNDATVTENSLSTNLAPEMGVTLKPATASPIRIFRILVPACSAFFVFFAPWNPLKHLFFWGERGTFRIFPMSGSNR